MALPAAAVSADAPSRWLGPPACRPATPIPTRPDRVPPAAPRPPPMLGTIYLDCSPLGADDVRDSSRTQADFVTGLTEALDTDGGVAVRLTAEVLAQRDEWSTGEFPFLQVRWDEFRYKVKQVWREKIGAPGISTELIKDQYGVIRRTDIGDVVDALSPGTRIVYFLPEHRHDDRTIRVEQVEQTLRGLAPEHGLDLRVVPIPAVNTPARRATPRSTGRRSTPSTERAPDVGPGRLRTEVAGRTCAHRSLPGRLCQTSSADPAWRAQSIDTRSSLRPCVAAFSASHWARNSSASGAELVPDWSRTVCGFLLGPVLRSGWLLSGARLERVPGEPGAGLGHVQSDEVGLDLGEVLGDTVPLEPSGDDPADDDHRVTLAHGVQHRGGHGPPADHRDAELVAVHPVVGGPVETPFGGHHSKAHPITREPDGQLRVSSRPANDRHRCDVPAHSIPLSAVAPARAVGRFPDGASGAATRTAAVAECGWNSDMGTNRGAQ